MKTLFVVNGHEYTAKHRLPLLEALRRRGDEVLAAAPSGSPALSCLREAGYDCVEFPLSRRGLEPVGELRSLRALIRLYRTLRPDLVHHATIKPVIYGGIAARAAGVPAVVNAVTGLGYVYTGDDLWARFQRWLVNPLYRRAFRHPNQRVVFQNREDWRTLADAGVLREQDGVLIPGSGVDVDRFIPAAEQPEPPVVALVGRMLWDKGVGHFVEAAHQVRAHRPEVQFWLVGDEDPGNPSAIGREQLERWNGDGAVQWLGPRNDMAELYRRMSVVCLPSRREGIPKVLLEAQACGLPVITTDRAGCRDAVADGETGFLVPTGDAATLAERIRFLLESPVLRARMGRAGRARAEQEFSVARVVRETLSVYSELLDKVPNNE